MQPGFDDGAWRQINLPHDWAIEGPVTRSGGGSMGRLPSAGIGWYRKKLNIPQEDAGKLIFLEVDGGMSYATVWLNGQVVGGWPFGYASWRLDLTRYWKRATRTRWPSGWTIRRVPRAGIRAAAFIATCGW